MKVAKIAPRKHRLGKIGLGVIAALASMAILAHAQQPPIQPKVPAAQKAGSTAGLGLIHNVLKVAIDSGQIPGGVVIVVKDGKILHFESQGVTAFGATTALRKDSIFGVASLSKPVTAVAIMMLVEEGKIKLSDPMSKYIPEFGVNRVVRVLRPGSPPAPFTPLPFVVPPSTEFGQPQYEMVPAEREMTVRDLLTHMSGIQIFGVSQEIPNPNRKEKLSDVIPRMAKAPLEFQPGSRWAYSNGVGFDVLGRVIEIASGMPLDKFMQQRIFAPLDMKDTGFGVRKTDMDRVVPVFPRAPVEERDTISYLSGADGLWVNVEDYSHFAQMLANGGEYNGHRLLKSETVSAMSSNQIGPLVMSGYPPMAMPPEGLKFGYGMMTVVSPVAAGTRLPAGSFGWDGVGTRRFWALKDSHVAIVSMVPGAGPGAAPFQRLLEAAVVQALDLK